MSQYPPEYSDTLGVNSTAPTLESDLVPGDTEQLLERCLPLPVAHQPQDKQDPIQQEDAHTHYPEGIPLTLWRQDCTWNSSVTTRMSLPTEQTAQENTFHFATKPFYFEVIVVLACLSMCFSLPIGLCAFCVALCAYSQFTDKKYDSALALSWAALGLGVTSVIVSIVAYVLLFKLYSNIHTPQSSSDGHGGTNRY